MACQKVCKVVGNICVATKGRTLMVITQVSSGLVNNSTLTWIHGCIPAVSIDILSTLGGMGREAQTVYKCLADLLSL